MNIKELREKTGMTQKAFSEWLNIPHRTVQNWEGGQRQCPEYVVELIAFRIDIEQKLNDGELVSKEWHDEQVLHAEIVIEELREKLKTK